MEDIRLASAKVLGWRVKRSSAGDFFREPGVRFIRRVRDWNPCDNWVDCGLLMDKVECVAYSKIVGGLYIAQSENSNYTASSTGATPQEAITKAIIAINQCS